MLTLKYITENTDEVIARLKKKNFDGSEIINNIAELDERRKITQSAADNFAAELNSLSKEIGMLFKQGKHAEANEAKEKTVTLKENISKLTEQHDEIEQKLQDLLVLVPNLPHESVPEGKHAEDNVVERSGGKIPQLHKEAVPHWDLAKKYDLIDFELGVKISGAGFPVYKGKGARLQRALINFFLDNAREAGYLEVQPNIVTILADVAVRADDMDEAAAETARQQAAQVFTNNSGELDYSRAAAQLAEAAAQLRTIQQLRKKLGKG